MSYFEEPGSHFRDKVKVLWDLSNYAIKKELEYATGADIPDLPAKKCIVLNSEVDKLDIAKLINVPTSLNNLKTKVVDLDIGRLNTVLVDLKKFSDVIDNEHCSGGLEKI